MPTWCIVPGCSNSSRKVNCKHLSWHAFPTQDEELLGEWLTSVGKKQVNKNWKICSEHFEPRFIEKTLAGRRRLRKGAVPSLFMQRSGKRRGKIEGSKAAKMPKVDSEAEQLVFPITNNDQSRSVVQETPDRNDGSIEIEKLQGIRRVIKELKQAKNKSQTQESSRHEQNNRVFTIQVDASTSTTLDAQDNHNSIPVYFDRISRLQAENDQLRMKLDAERNMWFEKEKSLRSQWVKKETELKQQQGVLLQENMQLKSLELQFTKEKEKRLKAEKDLEECHFLYKNLCKTPKLLTYYTGFNQEEYEAFLSFLGISSCENLSYEYAGLGFTIEEGLCPRGRPRAMKPRDQLLLVLCRLKMSFSEKDLGVRFNISQTQVSRTCTSLMNRMQTRFKEAGMWLENDKDPPQETIPDALRGFYPKIKSLTEALRVCLQKNKKCSLSMVVPI